MNNVRVYDSGAAFMIMVDGLITGGSNTLGGAWKHIEWMHRVASQEFTVGKSEKPVKEWLEDMKRQGWLD